MEIDWYKCKGDIWCDLNRLDLDHEYLSGLKGVYIIWCGTGDKSVVKIGKGLIPEELRSSREDLAVQAFAKLGLFVSWAEVGAVKRDSVEAYLSIELKPKISKPIRKTGTKVNLPW